MFTETKKNKKKKTSRKLNREIIKRSLNVQMVAEIQIIRRYCTKD